MKATTTLFILASLLAPLYMPANTSPTPQSKSENKATSTKSLSKRKHLYVIQGYFFDKYPKGLKGVKKNYPIDLSDEYIVQGISLDSLLTPEHIATAICKDSIPIADYLLSRQKDIETIDSLARAATLIKTGDKFPEFTQTDIDGKVWTNADCVGKPMVLNLWQVSCRPCRAEMPELSEWKNEMPDVMFFSSTWEDADTARPALEKAGVNWIHFVGDRQFLLWPTKTGKGYPMTIVVDKEGIVRQIEFGTSQAQRDSLKATIQSLR